LEQTSVTRIAAIRLRASCRFTSRNEIFFTHQRIQHFAQVDKHLPAMSFALSGRF